MGVSDPNALMDRVIEDSADTGPAPADAPEQIDPPAARDQDTDGTPTS